ncbi:MAG TPA: bifunctional proline dehydrogenase/L-glutamate gamma-semialdehyde dehydrogenase PutA [Steroidobacteraceae bacterium]|nr:bifunctional proline dehydrogenase/L-glutamate gamma-semialdehyde dehydrogenase PutA [Steroidobacteraceae bacterium]
MPDAVVKTAQTLARRLIVRMRESRMRAGGIDALMHEFSLSTQEGVALMCLAEALLRIPDADTADRLIRDKIGQGDWQAHLGRSTSLFVNAAAWGLYVSGKLAHLADTGGLTAALGTLIAKGGEPLIRQGVDLAMRLLGRQFVIADTIEDALQHAVAREQQGYRYSYDMLGEAALTHADAENYFAAYEHALHAVGAQAAGRTLHDAAGISVKLSALHPRYQRAQRERVLNELLPRLRRLFLLARDYNIGLSIDAEEADRLELSLDLIEAIALDPALAGFDGIGVVVQAYQKRCPMVIDWLADLAQRSGHRFMLRLVKGAYWDSEIKRAQLDGLPDYPVYTRKLHTDVSYLACARQLLAAPHAFYPQFATHNAYSVAAIHSIAGDAEYEFQCLHGMGESLYDQIVGANGLQRTCRIYAPVGSHQTLLPYLVRRLLENGANSSFVNRIVDASVSIDELIADPATAAATLRGAPHPRIPLPLDLYAPTRHNSPGLDLSDEFALHALDDALTIDTARAFSAAPMLGMERAATSAVQAICNPADRRDIVGTVMQARPDDIESALRCADSTAQDWAHTSFETRASLLERTADLLEADRALFISLLVREAGRALANAIGEVREAADFCRYYAAQLRAGFDGEGASRGPVVCISPWNFPLAIFTGQVSAALAAGNPVLAKPAEQTPLIAAQAVERFHRAGVPQAALQLLPGSGEVGAALVADERVRGVLFTGSTEVAKSIEATLAQRLDVVLIAETGGQNAMIADSSALAEQLVTDALASAFDSAGQRCSALRVLYLQSDIAERIVQMLKGAMNEIRVGNPMRLATDVGPVIDRAAREALVAHIEAMRALGFACHSAPLSDDTRHGDFVAPTLIEIDRIDRLPREIFGPVLHVIRYAADELDRVLEEINRTGYGLTHGIQSRIDETVTHIVKHICAGNVYVNRNIIGAVVGVQPFGGEGRSGTGPKAGGPLYLPRLMRGARARLQCANTNASLPALDALLAQLDRLPLAPAERDEVRRCAAAQRAESLFGASLPLAGPTGEYNELRFAARGGIGCLATSNPALCRQITAALATGNRTVLPRSAFSETLARVLPQTVELVEDLSRANVTALLWDGMHADARVVHAALMTRSPAIVPLITQGSGGYDLSRLIVERSLCINTAAAGGNAALMSLID